MTTVALEAPVRLDSIPAVEHFLQRHGYPVETVERGAGLRSLCEIGDVVIYASSGDRTVEQRQVELLARHARMNVLRTNILFHVDSVRCTIWLIDDRVGRASLELAALLSPTDEHRLGQLDLTHAGSGVDVRALFARLLDRDALTRQFFARFRKALEGLTSALQGRCPHETSETIHEQAMLILSRLLFLSFIQEKGWLDGNRNFLCDQYSAATRRGDDFYATTLLSLFFGCLNTPEAQRDPATRALGQIPYLNGGLFQPAPFELRNRIDLLEHGLMGEIVHDVFGAFDFTVDEQNASVLHIDPEMLGHVFETLMAGERRMTSGSFYTPRPVVERLVSQAITTCLIPDDPELRNRLRDHPEATLAAMGAERLIEVSTRLRALRILDPACGSGAFLLGSLYFLERLNVAADAALGRPVDPGLRQRIVAECLFGVDLSLEAVRLCELRLWLAIVAPLERECAEIRPLPNLDRNIFQGNSLFEPIDLLGDAPLSIHRDWSIRLAQRSAALRLYRNGSRDEKRAARLQLRSEDTRIATELLHRVVARARLDAAELDSQQELISTGPRNEIIIARAAASDRAARAEAMIKRLERDELDFFSYRIQCADVISDGGFDCVVGNPPWVRHSRIDPRTRQMLVDRFAFFRGVSTSFRQSDLALAFCEKSLDLVAPRGVISLLLPSKVITAGYAAALRNAQGRSFHVTAIDDWSASGRALFHADAYPIGLTFRRYAVDRVEVNRGDQVWTRTPDELRAGGRSNAWSLAAPNLSAVLRRSRERFPTLEEVLGRRPCMGVKTGANAIYFLENARLLGDSLLVDGVRIPLGSVCRVVRGRDVRAWRIRSSSWMLWSPNGRFDHRAPWVRDFAQLRGIDPHELAMSFVRPEHLGTKVVWKDLAVSMQSVAVTDRARVEHVDVPIVPNQSTYFLDTVSLVEAYQLAAVFNTAIVNALLTDVAESAKDAHFRFFGSTVAAVPFPERRDLISAGGELLRLSRRAHGGEVLHDELEQLSADLYRLSRRELAIVRNAMNVVR